MNLKFLDNDRSIDCIPVNNNSNSHQSYWCFRVVLKNTVQVSNPGSIIRMNVERREPVRDSSEVILDKMH